MLETIRNVVSATDVPLLGFAGAPFTVASYLIEGRPSRTYGATKALMFTDEALWFDLMEALADLAIASIRSQVAAGWRGAALRQLGRGPHARHYRRYVLPTSQRVFAELADLGVPACTSGWAPANCSPCWRGGADMVGVDWRVPWVRPEPGSAACRCRATSTRRSCWPGVDPRWRRPRWCCGAGHGGAHVFNLGHGVLPETDPEVLEALVEFVHDRGRGLAEAGRPANRRNRGGFMMHPIAEHEGRRGADHGVRFAASPDQIEAYYTHSSWPTARRGGARRATRPLRGAGRHVDPARRTADQVEAITLSLQQDQPGRWASALGQKHAAPFVEDGVETSGGRRGHRHRRVGAGSALFGSVGRAVPRPGTGGVRRGGVGYAGIHSWWSLDAYRRFLAREVVEALADLPAATRC
ncbi:MAG: uroporphyrinogen decarboxylase family protein [Acidimicrobiales bacterium]